MEDKYEFLTKYLTLKHLCSSFNNVIERYNTLLFVMDRFESQLVKSSDVVVDDELERAVSDYLRSSVALHGIYLELSNTYSRLCGERLERLRGVVREKLQEM